MFGILESSGTCGCTTSKYSSHKPQDYAMAPLNDEARKEATSVLLKSTAGTSCNPASSR